MKRKRLLIVLVAFAVLTVSFTVFALASDTKAAQNIRWFFGVDTSKFTDQQKADINESINKMTELQKENAQKMADLQKEAINKMVANGSMTKEQGDAAIKKIDEQLARIQQGELPKGFGLGMDMEKGRPGFPGKGGVDLSKLTDAQKADLKSTYDNIISVQKEAVNKLVSDGAITKEQGDAVIKKIENMTGKFEGQGIPFGIMGEGVFMPWDVKGIDTSKLTGQQKSDLKSCLAKIGDLQKEAVNKLVADGAMTREQGDEALKRIDEMIANMGTFSFPKGHGMKKGGFEEKGPFGGPNANKDTSPAL